MAFKVKFLSKKSYNQRRLSLLDSNFYPKAYITLLQVHGIFLKTVSFLVESHILLMEHTTPLTPLFLFCF